MKKAIALILAMVMALSMVACGAQTTTTQTPSAGQNAETTWPTSDITIIVPAAAGGGTDIFARAIADGLQRTTGKNFTVVNVDAGSGMVGFEQLRNSAPDGKTIMFWHAGFYVTYNTGRYAYDPNTAFSPVAVFTPSDDGSKQVFVVKGDAKWNSLEELLSDAAANPGAITYGCAAGGSAEMVARMLMGAGNAELRLVDAASQTDKITGVAGGNIDVSAITLSSALQYVENGDLKILGVVDKEGTSDYKSAYEQGYTDCYWSQNLLVYAPAGMEEGLVRAINEAISVATNDATTAETLKTAKMSNVVADYDTSMAMFEEYGTSVAAAVATMKG